MLAGWLDLAEQIEDLLLAKIVGLQLAVDLGRAVLQDFAKLVEFRQGLAEFEGLVPFWEDPYSAGKRGAQLVPVSSVDPQCR